jgi:broad specificity phosphatase PhoE
MKILALLIIATAFILTSCTHTYYVVRHAEKATASPGTTMSTPNDPPLSDAGSKRAIALMETLKNKKIAYIFSTNTIRTKTTAEPLSKSIGISIETYKPMPDTAFINSLKKLKKNVLVVGHSNTVDDLSNMLAGKKVVPGDLEDSEYDNLFVIKYKGKKVLFERLKF